MELCFIGEKILFGVGYFPFFFVFVCFVFLPRDHSEIGLKTA
jgi:hypothetical protein